MNGVNGDQQSGSHHFAPKKKRLNPPSQPPLVADLEAVCCQKSIPNWDPPSPDHGSKHHLADSTENSIPIYSLPEYGSLKSDQLSALQDEWYDVLYTGPGVLVLKAMYKDRDLIENINEVYAQIISDEQRSSPGGGDHFGSGHNDRIWDSFSKHCLYDSTSFTSYYSNPWLALICEAWLGPAYRITAQVNVVKPGGPAQMAHRDYHLGFQAAESIARFPRAMQVASQLLTLQGAVAHTDMPLESGPTRLLPFSQKYEEGFLAYRRPEFRQYFENHYVTLPLKQGDGLFFNPALFHAAGENQTTDFNRVANLLQISSAFGKPMETIHTLPLIDACYDQLVEMYKRDGESPQLKALVAAVAEGYPFPTNLDRNPPRQNGMAPASQQEVITLALRDGKTKAQVTEELERIQASNRSFGKRGKSRSNETVSSNEVLEGTEHRR